ncbi:MAG: helix-turn-helix domain-containing protein [Shewanella sp.]|jgi:excisionase family DNA binding protein|nr:helix-turn-helix domain-containing protein [Shewanella sp.]MCF1458738.1 helix-turn-helix domain-containing protein [Shewanella sp.]
MTQSSDEVMTIEELAAYLKIPKSTLYKQVQEGKVPGQKIGKQWRFGKKAIDRWINESSEDQHKE